MNKNRILLLLILLVSVGIGWADNNVYTIYPVPQKQSAGNGTATFSKEVTIVADSIIDNATIERARSVLTANGLNPKVANAPSATESNLFLAVDKYTGTAQATADSLHIDRSVLSTQNKYDRHIVHLYGDNGNAQCLILGESVNATFFGLASLEQMLEAGTADMKTVTIEDYADQQSRGLVEGYYGYPYSVEVKKQLMHFMMRMKMNTYMYGAKSDPYHSNYWQNPYPTSLTAEQIHNGLLSQDMMRDVAKTSAETKVHFIWAIHPGGAFVTDNNIVNKIMNKFTSMYSLGVRRFAVFVDDVGVPGNEEGCKSNADHLTALQNAIDAKWNSDTARAENRVEPLHFVPQVYALSFTGEDNRKRFYRYLGQTPKKITIYITGNGVWSVPNVDDLNTVKEEMGREAAWWWNYPCNDNADGQLFLSDMYYNFYEMPQVNGQARLPSALTGGLGVVSNPMQEGMVSRTPLFSVADYAWNNSAFNNEASWQASFNYTMDTQGKRDAYKAIIPYLRWHDPAEMQSAVNNYKNRNASAFLTLAEKLRPSVDTILALQHSQSEADQLLYKDLSPWINKLDAMLRATTNMAPAISRSNDNATRWESYARTVALLDSIETDSLYTAFALEGMGNHISVSQRQSQPSQTYLYPLMSWLRNSALESSILGTAITKSAQKIASTQAQRNALSLRNNTTSLSLSASRLTLAQGEYVGISLPQATRLTSTAIADTLIYKYDILYSDNGKKWNALLSKGLPEDAFVKHVILLNNSGTTRTLSLPQGAFTINMPALSTISSIEMPSSTAGAQSSGNKGLSYAIDGDPETFFAPKHDQVVGDKYTVTLAQPTDVRDVRLYFGTTNGDYLEQGRMEVSRDGNNWTSLNLKGTNTKLAGNAQATPYNNEINYLDFEGNVKNAKYVRLNVTKIPGRKWLRVYDFQINRQWYVQQFLPAASYADSTAATALSDRLPYTKADKAGDIIYHFQDMTYPNTVNIYWNPSEWTADAPAVETTTDGITWTSAGQLTDALTTVSIDNDVIALRLAAQDKNADLPVYEISEVTSSETAPITGLNSVKTAAPSTAAPQPEYNLHGQRVDKSYKGIVISKGHKTIR